MKIKVEKDKKHVKIRFYDRGYNFVEKDILGMLIDKDVYDNLSLDFDNLQQVVKSIGGIIKEILSNKGNEVEFIMPITYKETENEDGQKIVSLFN